MSASFLATILASGLVGVIVGVGVGLLVGRLLRDGPIGFLRIDRSDPDGPYLFLELMSDRTDRVRNGNVVTLVVKDKNLNSQD